MTDFLSDIDQEYQTLPLAYRVRDYKFMHNHIADLRKQEGLTQNQLAGVLGVTNNLLGACETGRKKITTGMAITLAAFFRVSVYELLGIPRASLLRDELCCLSEDMQDKINQSPRLAASAMVQARGSARVKTPKANAKKLKFKNELESGYFALPIPARVEYGFLDNNMKTYREEAGISQIALSKKLSVLQKYISEWETQKRRLTLNQAIIISAIVGTDIYGLLNLPKAHEMATEFIFSVSKETVPYIKAEKEVLEQKERLMNLASHEGRVHIPQSADLSFLGEWAPLLTPLERAQAITLHENVLLAEERGDGFSPEAPLVFRALQETPPSKVKAVIVNRCPRRYREAADGLAFSERAPGMHNVRMNDFFEGWKEDTGYDYPERFDLTSWANEGVLLLNQYMTNHSAGLLFVSRTIGFWLDFTRSIITHCCELQRPLVLIFPLYSTYHVFRRNIKPKEDTLVLMPEREKRGFYPYRWVKEEHVFAKTNQFLVEHGSEPLSWKIE